MSSLEVDDLLTEENKLLQADAEESDASLKFEWTRRLECIEVLAAECEENGGGFERALRTIRLRNYCRNADKMTIKQKNTLKRDVAKQSKDIQFMRQSADVGDVVRVTKLVPNPLIGGYKREGNKTVEAVVISKRRSPYGIHYQVKRLQDEQLQEGNGHMIKAIVSKVV